MAGRPEKGRGKIRGCVLCGMRRQIPESSAQTDNGSLKGVRVLVKEGDILI